ncbi:MAG: hypothetical protein JXR48_16345 [Candidatus Delongbacteria bacterium]|nr:hypothetical protein [Candidatus Delongbacteria bacterium]MBN2836528.1 hypothetical protein [Candidatus Delongbacteria bacterium]
MRKALFLIFLSLLFTLVYYMYQNYFTGDYSYKATKIQKELNLKAGKEIKILEREIENVKDRIDLLQKKDKFEMERLARSNGFSADNEEVYMYEIKKKEENRDGL